MPVKVFIFLSVGGPCLDMPDLDARGRKCRDLGCINGLDKGMPLFSSWCCVLLVRPLNFQNIWDDFELYGYHS